MQEHFCGRSTVRQRNGWIVKKYYGIENDSQMAITVDDQIVEPHGMISDGKAYVQYEVVRDYINSRFYWDANENKLLYTLPTDIVTVEIGSKDYSVSKERKVKIMLS